MIKNYIKIAWRNLMKNKSFSLINIIGLAIGMAGALLIALWLQNMLTMDRFHEKGNRLYVLSNRDEFQGDKSAWAYTPKILAPSLAADFPDIETFTRYNEGHQFLTTFKEKNSLLILFSSIRVFSRCSLFHLLKANKMLDLIIPKVLSSRKDMQRLYLATKILLENLSK